MKNKKKTMIWAKILLRLPEKLIFDIDKIRFNRLGMTRTAWILEAIQEKFKKE